MSLKNVIVAIPSRANADGLVALVNHVHSMGVAAVLIYDNGYENPDWVHVLGGKCEVINARGWPFYKMWNHAWAVSSKGGFDAVALLNDDITLHDDSLAEAFRVMQASKQVGIVGLNYNRNVSKGTAPNAGSITVHGSYRNHGIGGHAFLVNAATYGDVPEIDENYSLWYGDDELFAAMEAYGYSLKIALGAPVDHVASTTSNQFPELLAKTGKDAELFYSRWG